MRANATVFWCGQSLFKYLPQFDEVFPRIARETGDCQFAFIRYGWGTHLDELFLRRLDRAFARFGLKAADHCVMLPRLNRNRFVAAIGQCDIVLDSIGWSGCNSTLEGLHHDLPIVTMTGSLMRGRHTMAILERIERRGDHNGDGGWLRIHRGSPGARSAVARRRQRQDLREQASSLSRCHLRFGA